MIAGRPVTVACNGVAEWGELASQRRFDPATVWGFVIFTFDSVTGSYRPADDMQLAEAACWYLDQLWRAPPDERGKVCRVTTQLTVPQKKAAKRVTKYRVCPNYMKRVFALQTISHEAQHLAGIRDEATAECSGLQNLAWFAEQFGSTADQARQMASDYYHDFYETRRPGTPYYLPTCPDPTG